ncbi:MAG: hypothetical protein Fur0010_03420 [Bdellovibrio sp.]
MRKTNAIIITLIISGLIAGCAKQREEQFDQGAGVDLLSISEFQGQTFVVETQDIISKTKITNAQELKDENIPVELNNLNMVRYTTTSPLLGDFDMRGKPHSNYQFNYELTDKHLIINKLAARENLPFQEMTYAKQIGDNLYAVPMIGYPITLYRVENAIDSNGDKSHRLIELRKDKLEEATHFKVDKFQRVVFDAVKKNDVFPASIFEGEWFYAATIVSAGLKNATSIGRDLSVDFEAESVSRIKFIATPNSVRAVNTNLDSNIDRQDAINLQTAVEIPVNWVDFRVVKNGRNYTLLKEEKVGDGHQDAVDWSKRKFAEVNFAKVKSILTQSTSTSLENIEISEGFLSFTVHYTDEQIKIKYALKKAHDPKAGRIYRKDDRKLYGLFTTIKHFINNHRFHRDGDYEKQIMMNRFYPEKNKDTDRKEIRYFFSNNTPEYMKNAGKRAIKAWNDTFKAAGSDIDVVLDESKTVSLGDIRYNIINIVDTKDGSGLLGYGPSIVDSESGEIISATTNIYANPFREGLINSIRNYIKREIGLFEKTRISTIASQEIVLDKSNIENWANYVTSKKLYFDKKIEKAEELKYGGILKEFKQIEAYSREMLSSGKKLEQTKYGQQCNFSVTNSDVITRIEENCKNEISQYIEDLKESGQTFNENELSVIGQCAEKLLEDDVVATLVHEMGHNLGLRHNFMASADADNFIKDKNGKLIPSSSAMDYSNGTVAELLTPGSYDEEVIRFAYANKITLKDGHVTAIDTNKSLKDQGLNIKKFKYCTDENVNETDPMCQRWDYGTNPKEVVQSIINNFNASFEINGHKHDRAFGPNDAKFAQDHFEKTLIPLKKIHDQWRYHLAEFVTKRNQYLESYDENTFVQVLEAMKNDQGIHGENYRMYYEANVLAFNFLKNLLMTPARYCMVTSNANSVEIDLIDFEKIKDEFFKESHVTVKDCSDPLVVAKFESNGLNFVKTVGEFMNAQKVTLDISDPDFSKNESVGLSMLRKFAAFVLEMRIPMFKQHKLDNFTPNFFDNPIFRKEIGTYLVERIINGVTPNNVADLKGAEVMIPLFETERNVLSFAYEMFLEGITIPEKLESSLERRTPFNVIMTSDPSFDLPEGAIETKFASKRFIATNRNPIARKLIEKREDLRKMKSDFNKQIIRIRKEDIQDILTRIPSFALADLKDISFEEFIQKLDLIVKVIARQQGRPELFNFLNEFFSDEIALVNRVYPAIKEQSPEALAKPAETILANFIMGDNQLKIFSKEGQEEKIDMYVQINENRIARKELFRKNVVEFEAQLDMLTEILLSM